MLISRRFDALVRALGEATLSERACNQFSYTTGDLPGNALRRRNLRLYLTQMDLIRPKILMIGEAVSYRGGRRTGLAFVSETLMLRGVAGVLGSGNGFRKATSDPVLSTEASATMVWGTIAAIDPLPLLWNAFPYHPFHAGNPHSNRLPTSAELAMGEIFIKRLMRLFPIEIVVAIGNQADRSLDSLEVEHTKVRHPSQGGKLKFVAGMRNVASRLNPEG